MNKDHSGCKKSARTLQNINLARELIENESTNGIRKIAAMTNLKRESVRKILKTKLFPYKLQCLQKLYPEDKMRRLRFCATINEPSSANQLNIENIFSDECHIYLEGMINKQNFRKWSPEKPSDHVEKPLHSPKITVWCGLSAHKIYGPYFFRML